MFCLPLTGGEVWVTNNQISLWSVLSHFSLKWWIKLLFHRSKPLGNICTFQFWHFHSFSTSGIKTGARKTFPKSDAMGCSTLRNLLPWVWMREQLMAATVTAPEPGHDLSPGNRRGGSRDLGPLWPWLPHYPGHAHTHSKSSCHWPSWGSTS